MRDAEQKALIEEQERALEVVNHQQENLLHFISHEVKGFLAKGQNAFAGIVEGDYGEAPPKIKEISSEALVEMRKGVSTVMDILDASNLKKGTMDYKKNSFDLCTALEEATHDAEPRAKEKNLNLSYTCEAGSSFVLTGDEEKIKRHVIRNLIDNALRYTLTGSIAVALKKHDDSIVLSVTDTGVGISPDDMSRLFTEGGHGKDSIKVNVDSTGYGLYVAKRVVEAHGGTISAHSEGPGKGSEFRVILPVTH
jgi:signal transduction histidine kinase